MPLPEFLKDTDIDLALAAKLLRGGEIVALPTETVYGLAADALNPAAVEKIFSAKGRPLIDPLIVHVADLDSVEKLATVPPELSTLAGVFWPGPLTVVLEKKGIVPGLVTAGLPTVAVRMPAHPVMRKVLWKMDGVLAAPSANPFGYISPTEARHVRESLGEKAPWIVDGGPCLHGLESTILHLADGAGPRLLRPGPISREQLEAVLGRPVLAGGAKEKSDGEAQAAPGMLTKHYSPLAAVVLRRFGEKPRLMGKSPAKEIAVVWQGRPIEPVSGAANFWLSEDGDPVVAARNVFALLRRLDRKGFVELQVELAEETGVGVAMNDRLRRAAARA